VLYALLGHAVSTAASVEDARRIVEGFADEFGLLATAEVLAYKVALASIDPANLIEASRVDSTGRRNTSIRRCVDGTAKRVGDGSDRKAWDAVARPASGGAA
jgi:hypothetical protein